MAQATSKLTYDAVGNREDLIDIITNISPTETPMLSRFGKTKAEATRHEWLTDSLATATANAHIEGADYTFTKPAARARLSNDTQIYITDVKVSNTQRSVNTAGLEDEFAYQMTKKMKEHARDIEWSLVNATGNSGASGTARTLKGVLSWVTTNNVTGTGTGNEALTEAFFNQNLQNIWNQGGQPDTCYANGFQKRKISAFTATSTRNINASEKEVIVGIDVYDSDFGRIKIVPDRFMPAGEIVVVQSDLFKVAVLRPTKKYDVPAVGSYTRAVIETELTLESRNQAGSGKVTLLTTS
jgi:hypothetical protein